MICYVSSLLKGMQKYVTEKHEKCMSCNYKYLSNQLDIWKASTDYYLVFKWRVLQNKTTSSTNMKHVTHGRTHGD